MRCEQAQPNLLDYSRGLLSGRDAAEVRRHVAACAECRAVAEDEVRLASRLSALPRPQPEADVWGIVQAKVRSAPRRPSLLDVVRRTYSRRLAAAVAAVAAVLLLAFVVVIPRQTAQPEREAVKQAIALMRIPDQQADPVGTTDAMMEVLQREAVGGTP